jgi:hypothetical protein
MDFTGAKEVLMDPDLNMECLTRKVKEWHSAPTSQTMQADRPRQAKTTTRSRRSRRPRSESTRTMLEMLRALAQAEANTFGELNKRNESSALQGVVEVPESTQQEHTLREDHGDADTSAAREQPGLQLLRATILGSEPDEIELHCQYCSRVFRLQDGGASFEGNAACSNCEQRLNRDVVLPAVGKNRPHMYQVCDAAQGPEQPKRPAWARQSHLPGQDGRTEGSPSDPTSADAAPAVVPAIGDFQAAGRELHKA